MKSSLALPAVLTISFSLFAAASRFADADVIRYPASPGEQRVAQALDLMKAGKLEEADRVFADLLKSDPQSVLALLGRAQVLLGTGAVEQAEARVREVVASHPGAPEAHNMLGVVLLARRQPAAAKREFEQALKLRPTYVTPRAHLAALARMNGNWSEAETHFQELIRLAPREPFGHLGLAELRIVRQGVPAGLAVLEDWKRVDPRSAEPYAFKAEVCAAQRLNAEAAREIAQAVKMTPPSVHAFRVQGDLLASQGDWAGASAGYERAIALQPDDFDAQARLAAVYAEHGKPAQAMAMFQKLTVQLPGFAVAFNNLAYLRASQGTTDDETVRLAERALALAPAYGEAMHTLGRVRLLRNECALALKPLTDARARLGERPDVLLDLGTCYERLGKKTEALGVYTKALALAPPAEKARIEQALKRLGP